jgi:hypothetical protein
VRTSALKPGTLLPPSCESVWPPRLEPPVPRKKTSAESFSFSDSASIAAKSSLRSGNRSSASERFACASRSDASAGSSCLSLASNADREMAAPKARPMSWI